MKKVLIIEDDNLVSFSLKVQLENKGFEVAQVFNGSAAIRKVISVNPDIILLDINLPDKNGFEICQELREFYQGGIVFLTASDSIEAEVTSFGLGADDYVNKKAPFEILYQRIKRLGVRPKAIDVNQVILFDDIEFQPNNADCYYEGQALRLTQEEYELFYFIATKRGEIVSRQLILKVLKGADYNGIDRSIDIKIARIRRKLKRVGLSEQIIKSVRSKGYQFNYPVH
ncbi:response regulator transcription factor [Thalassotalea castellviae]|uniref:Response regulator transcription factor n=1 Tax=Thalassotalea castellviae TaxID=3075612 RepID=A0ABU3A193_9GAMM|nr:response regulator transcription factor [Thalassotalea sp. W431]MDT0603940.1 response regulator transcription factor [Thalassotalea sp. W431]